MLVSEIMTKEVVTVTPDDFIQHAAELMSTHSLTGLPVVNGEKKIVGIITEYDLMTRDHHVHIPTYLDILDRFHASRNPDQRLREQMRTLKAARVKDTMTETVEVVSPDSEVKVVARLVTEKHINPVPVVDQAGILVGIISRSDIIKLLA